MKKQMIGVFAALMVTAAGTITAQAGDWKLTEDGKNWMYLYSEDDPAKDEWIEDQGKIYYLDSKGYMKTGWVSNKDDKKKYYMGSDGAMAFNTIASDGRYVGPEGTGLDGYDKYRKAVRAELKKTAPKKSNSGKNSQNTTDQEQIQQFFTMADLNQDGYQDLVVMTGVQEAQILQEVAIWSPDEGKFVLAAEFDTPLNGQHSVLYLDPQGEEIWLEMTEPSGEMYLFQMEAGSAAFESVWSFTMAKDSQDYPQYYVNGDVEDRQMWELLMEQARQRRGNIPLAGYVPATEENISAKADLILSESEVDLWK